MKKQFIPAFCIAAVLTLNACETTKQTTSSNDVQAQVNQLLRLGEKTELSGDLANAIGFYRRAFVLDNSNKEALYILADAIKQSGDIRAAETLYTDALSRSPEDVETMRRYANTLIELDKLPQAIIQLNKALELSPDHAPSLNSLGVAYDMQGRHDEAQTQYEKSLNLVPDNLDTLNNHALSLAIEGEYDKALDLLKPFENDLSSPKRLRLNIALIYGLMGNEKKASLVAGQMLDREAVENNLKVYKNLRTLSIQARKEAVLGK